MKLGIISDIHADLAALQLALDLLKSQHVDQIICAGDIVDKGYDTDAVVELLQAEGILSIAGNHDYPLQGNDKIKATTIEFLEQLPRTLTLNYETTNILVAHGAPWSDFVYIYPTSERHVFKRLAREVSADVVILGHTHAPFFARINNINLYNPGSLCGTYCAGSRTCATLTLPTMLFEVFDLTTRQVIEVPFVEIFR